MPTTIGAELAANPFLRPADPAIRKRLGLEAADDTAVFAEIRRRKEARGNKVVGLKMGLTSWAKMAQMGVETPIYGFLADYFSVPDGGVVNTKELIHPKMLEKKYGGEAENRETGFWPPQLACDPSDLN